MNTIPHHTPLTKRPYEKPTMRVYELHKRHMLLVSNEDYVFNDSELEW